MKLDLGTIKTLVGIMVGAITVGAAIWKILLPLFRRILKARLVYAACIAELSQYAPGLLIETPLDAVVPIRRFPGYSDWSIQAPNAPPRSREDQRKFFEVIATELSGPVLKDANDWERTAPTDLRLLGSTKAPEFKLYETYLRLRWLLLKEGKPSYDRVAKDVGRKCAEALEKIESAINQQLDQLPTRALIIRIKNRGSKDAKDLNIEITSGGAIYDVVINDWQPSKMEKTTTRLALVYETLRPGQMVELKVWYRWIAVEFGNRMFSQARSFPGREGILINYIGVSNGRVLRMPKLLSDIDAWRSLETEVGPETGFGRF